MSHPHTQKNRKPMAMAPRWARPKLRPDQLIDLGIVHATNVDEIKPEAKGRRLWPVSAS